MTEMIATEAIARRDDPPMPLLMPVLLSFVAGYLDSYTYLSLFGLFVAQVTGSFVIAGAEFVTSDYGIAGKLIAIAAFVTAAAVTAAFCIAARDAQRPALPAMLGLEALLLAVFVGIMLFGPEVRDARDWHGIVAGVFAAMAMGAQSVLVRLLMKDIPQTNVMTGNMTQLGIAATELIMARLRMARRRFDHARHGDAAVRDFANARGRLVTAFDRGRIPRRRRGRRAGLRHHRRARGTRRCRYRRCVGAMGAHAAGAVAAGLTRPLRPPGRAAMRFVEMHEMLEHLFEGAALARRQRLEDQPLRRLHRRLDVANKPPARRRDAERLGAPVARAIDAGNELLALQAADHPADRGAVKSDEVAQRRLIDTGMAVDRDQRGILHRRHGEGLGLIEEQRKGNLVQPANEMARHLDEAALPDRLGHVRFPAREVRRFIARTH